MIRGANFVRQMRNAATLAALAVATTAHGGQAGSPAGLPAGPAAASAARTVHDPAVSPAGGFPCSHCGTGRCHHAPAGRGHHAGCRDGACVPYCPVRPHQFGFYGTRWRKWPGQDIVPVSAERATTPAVPPRSAVPGADEESMTPRAGDDFADPQGIPQPRGNDAPGGQGQPSDSPLEPAVMPQPAPEPRPAAPATRPAPPADSELFPARPEPPSEPKAPALPEPKAEPTPPEDENLFEVRSSRSVRRRFVLQEPAREADPVPGEPAAVRPARHTEANGPLAVPPVPFDEAAETRRVRSTR